MDEKQTRQLKELFEAAHKDPALKMKLLAHPEEAAKERGVVLGDREIERLKKVGVFLELSNEIKSGRVFQCNPQVCYPTTLWFRNEVVELIKEYMILEKRDWVLYPMERRIDRKLGLDQRGAVQGGIIIEG
jgi:hypothetical protein